MYFLWLKTQIQKSGRTYNRKPIVCNILLQITSSNQTATQCYTWNDCNYYIMKINKNYMPNKKSTLFMYVPSIGSQYITC